METSEVNSRESFVRFIEELKADLDRNPKNWQNINLTDFLSAMARYSEDVQGYYDNTKQPINADTASWRVFADILIGASIYE